MTRLASSRSSRSDGSTVESHAAAGWRPAEEATSRSEGQINPAAAIGTHPGLSSADAARRLVEHGRNEIRGERRASAWTVLARQFNSPLIWLLVGACAIAAVAAERGDAIAIAAIVALNGAIGFFQERRAGRAILALRSMTAPRARVIRDGRIALIAAAEVVPGDLLSLEPGDVVAADASLLEANAFSTNEAMLTGESVPAEKSLRPAPSDAPLAERRDSVFMGTSAVTGSAVAAVVATGMRTELGRIANLLATVEDTATPLQQRLARVGRTLMFMCLGVVVLVAIAGALRGWPWLVLMMSSISLAVAAVPEGLPAIVTIAMAVGVQRMAARHVLIRRLPAVETLGCATVICTDKTGTLTTGAMAVRELWGRDHQRLLFAAAACSTAEPGADGRSGVGDPTELAILAASAERGITRHAIETASPRLRLIPFDADRKRMSIARADGCLYVKGAVEAVLPLCANEVADATDANAQMAARGLRVLAVAVGQGIEERDLELLGLVAIADPPRPEAIEAVAAARRAGITTVMITGDHRVTALAIARELGILGPGDSPDGLVHARATPADKLSIVRAWKTRNAVVAMTGDGVNDAPALREAHIGIAMGRGGTEVTREASDMILADDNFASIVAAVREGRAIFENIRKALVYLLSGNTAELLVMLVATVLGLPLPLLPVQLLWINVVTDGLPALALVMDPADDDVLSRPPRSTEEPMLARAQWTVIVFTGLLEAATTLSVFLWALRAGDLAEARSLAFTTLIFCELFRAVSARSETRTFWEVGPLTNVRVLLVVLISVGVQLVIFQGAATRSFFQLEPLSLANCVLALTVGLIPVTVLEIRKIARRAGKRDAGP